VAVDGQLVIAERTKLPNIKQMRQERGGAQEFFTPCLNLASGYIQMRTSASNSNPTSQHNIARQIVVASDGLLTFKESVVDRRQLVVQRSKFARCMHATNRSRGRAGRPPCVGFALPTRVQS
jgi:hypothetical protein